MHPRQSMRRHRLAQDDTEKAYLSWRRPIAGFGGRFRLASAYRTHAGPLRIALGRAGRLAGDVDFARQRIHVLRTVSEIRDHFVVGTTKTGETRTVIFPSLLRPCLEEACAGRRPSDLLFPDRRTGSYLRRAHGRYRGDWFCRAKRAVLDEDAAASMTVHDLRHTCASLLVHAGANVKAVQRQLGHKSAAMTLDVYADLFDDDLDDLSERMGGLLFSQDVGKMWAQSVSSAVDSLESVVL